MRNDGTTLRTSEASLLTVSVLPTLAEGSVLAGRYEILALLGTGAMGMVYRARDRELGLTVAIKVLRPELARDAFWVSRFKRELLLARQVSHANVVRIHDFGTDGELSFLSMDFVPGRSLGEVLGERQRLEPARAAEIARQIALALEAAHLAKVIHRDIKPSNVMVDESGEQVRVALTDFGIARSLSRSGRTLPGSSMGTPGYLSPEQARADPLDGRSDLYSLGVLMFEMLNGRLPHSDTTVDESPDRLWDEERELLAWMDGTPGWLRAIVERLLSEDPAQRQQSATDLLRELDRAGRPPLSHRTGWRVLAAASLLLAAAVRGGPHLPPTPVKEAPARAAILDLRASVALLPLADDTGRGDLAWMAAGMPEMLAASLAESPQLRVLDSPRVFSTLDDLNTPRGPLPDADARRLAGLLDANHLISGRVSARGGRLAVELALLVMDRPGVPAIRLRAEAPEGEASRLVEELGGMLRRRLEVPADVTAARAPSRSPVALAEYARGAASLASGDALAAVPALEKAVAADPACTAAWVQLAKARQALGLEDPARDAARRAVATLGTANSRVALRARAVEAQLLGHPERAQEILARLLARYPGDAGTRIELAQAYGEQGNLERAIAVLREAVRQAPHHPQAWYLLGKYSILAGDARRAVDAYLPRALVVQNELGSEPGRAQVLNAFGVAYRNLGQMDRAAASYEASAVLRRRIGDERGYATTQRNLANIQMVRGDHEGARARLQEALAILRRLGDTPGLADLYNDFGALAEQQGDYEEARDRYQQAMRLRRDLGNDIAYAQSLGNVGFAYYMLGRYDDAQVYWRQGLDLARKTGDERSTVLATQNLGMLELARGDWDDAVKLYLDALTASRNIGLKETIPVSLLYLGRLARAQGRPGAALASYAQALAAAREIGDQRGLAEIHLATAEVSLDLEIVDAAEESLRSAGEALERSGNHDQLAELERLRGELLLLRGRPEEAAQALRRSVAEARASHSTAMILATRLSAAGLPGRKEGLAELEALRRQAEDLGDASLRLRAAESVARAALAGGDPVKAWSAARDGLTLAADCGGYGGTFRLRRLLAEALESGGRTAEAADERRLADEEVARLERELGANARKASGPLEPVPKG
jgi:tetratricopeptide (TPR) repeat protein/TolB-like protein